MMIASLGPEGVFEVGFRAASVVITWMEWVRFPRNPKSNRIMPPDELFVSVNL